MLSAITEKITSLIIAAGSLFFSSVTGINPGFSDVKIVVEDNQIVCSASLTNCYSKDLDKIFLSGQNIKINFTIQTFEQGKKKPIYEKKFYHQIKYDLVDEYFEVFLSEKKDNFITNSLKEAKDKLARVEQIEAAKSTLLKFGKKYYIKLIATMQPIFFDAFQKNIDLMIYWNNKKATFSSELFVKPLL